VLNISGELTLELEPDKDTLFIIAIRLEEGIGLQKVTDKANITNFTDVIINALCAFDSLLPAENWFEHHFS